jgi:hypothetical protein
MSDDLSCVVGGQGLALPGSDDDILQLCQLSLSPYFKNLELDGFPLTKYATLPKNDPNTFCF